MSRQWLKRCAIGAMTVVMTVSSLPMAAFADPNGDVYKRQGIVRDAVPDSGRLIERPAYWAYSI